MNYKKLSIGLGVFSIAVGAAELLFTRRIARALDVEDGTGVIRAFGAREIAAGINLLAAPAHSTNIWNRVAGDAMDLAALGLVARRTPDNRAVWGALAFVAGTALIDIVTASGLDGETGKLLPVGR